MLERVGNGLDLVESGNPNAGLLDFGLATDFRSIGASLGLHGRIGDNVSLFAKGSAFTPFADFGRIEGEILGGVRIRW